MFLLLKLARNQAGEIYGHESIGCPKKMYTHFE